MIRQTRTAAAALLRTTTGRLVATGAVLLASTLAIVTIGAQAIFTDSVTDDIQVTTGDVDIRLGDGSNANTEANRFSVAATNVAAGDTIQRAVNVINDGTLNLDSILVSAAATTSSLLDTDTTNGLFVKVDRCSVAWTESGDGGATPYTYTCGGTTTSNVIARTAVSLVANAALTSSPALTAGATGHYLFTLDLDSGAFQPDHAGLTSVIEFTFGATQRAATSR